LSARAIRLAEMRPGQHWELVFDTADDDRPPGKYPGKSEYQLRDWSAAVFRARPDAAPEPPSPRTRANPKDR